MEQGQLRALQRRRKSKGRYMQLVNPEAFDAYMGKHRYSNAAVGRHAGVSRQFVQQLRKGEKRTCSDEVGRYIEEALQVPPGTFFLRHASTGKGPSVSRRASHRSPDRAAA
jgi:hypothetical protein